MRLLLVVLVLQGFSVVTAQNKKTIDTEAYYRWKTIGQESISDGGNWVMYKEMAYRGNDELVLMEKGTETQRWDRAKRYHMDPLEFFIVVQQTLDYDSIRQLKIEKVKKKKWPKDSIGIYMAKPDTTYWFNETEGFQTGDDGGLVLISHSKKFSLPKEEVEKPKKKCFLRKKKDDPADKKGEELEGEVLTVFNGYRGEMKQYEHVLESSVSEEGFSYAYVQSVLDDTVVVSKLFTGSIDGGTGFHQEKELFAVDGEITNLTWGYDAFLAFNVSVDTTDAKRYQLYLHGPMEGAGGVTRDSLVMVLDTVSDLFKSYQGVSTKSMEFGEGDAKLFFQVGVKQVEEKKDTIPDDEKAKVDIWSWTDGKIQPQQLKSAKKDALGLIDYVYHLNGNFVVQLQDTSAQSLTYQKDRYGKYAMLMDQTPYLKEMTWDFWYYDVYRVNTRTGEKEMLLKHTFGWQYALSPSGRKFTFWNTEDSCWYLKDIETAQVFNLTREIDDKFYERDHDVPSKVMASGNVYWFEKEQSLAVESQNELWIIPVLSPAVNTTAIGKPYKFTKGNEKNESYSMFQFDEDKRYFSMVDGFYLKSFNHETKSEGLYHYGVNGLELLGNWDAKLLTMEQAEDEGSIVIEKMTFTESPDLFALRNGKLEQLTDVNPQQSEYNWATVEMVSWKDYNGDSVNGLLYKPEDFDPSKSYPMIVYYYETYTDNIHYYYRPKPTASIIYPTEYASSGYVVFIPDIKYEIGHPAKSAYNVIMSGTDAVLEAYPNIDSTRMGLQGQSWGGYQTAQLVTMTTRYKCAMAGAPVSNMFSAYGGVRWGSGLSRTFQYETGQSRIGATIWEAPELYIENSPLFHLPKVETPLLIMHNDGDGAVPWYQGIELYQGLRRLQKPVWMFNYNDDEHNLMKDANRMDLSVRMKAFFDYYLLDQPAPEWLLNGVPAVDKGEK